jgi:aspartate kinase
MESRYNEDVNREDQRDEPAPVVMKFGGSSVADLDRLRGVAARIVARAAEGPVVAVVSAMGKTTNELVELARRLVDPPPARELDMLLTTGERESMALLAIAIAGLGRRAVSLTGSQCGIITDHRHGCSRIMEVRPFRVRDELAAGNVVIVGGFQGVSYKRDITTLGRGGSDSTAVALAAALGADCEIYSDVEGVHSADPRDVPGARRLDQLSYEEMLALSRAGAKVLHAQAVQLAQERGVAIYARSTSGADGESVVRAGVVREHGVRAVASLGGVVALHCEVGSWRGASCPAKVVARLGALGLRFLAIDPRGARGLVSAVQRTDVSTVCEQFRAVVRSLGEGVAGVECSDGHALVSCIGAGLEERSELAGEAVEALSACGVEVRQVCTDSLTMAFLVPDERRVPAVRALHHRFVESLSDAAGG